jgi:molybdate transport system substrate-binding protein
MPRGQGYEEKNAQTDASSESHHNEGETAMNKCLMATITMGLILLFAQSGVAQNDALRLIASNGVKAVLEEVLPQAEKTIGHPVAAQFGTTADFKDKIAAGEEFDLAILAAEAIDDLNISGKTVRATRADISRVGIGIGIRAGATKPDIRTPEKLKQVLLNAKTITYAPKGASTPDVVKMIEALGIAEKLKPKTMLLQGSELTTAAVAEGRADYVITLISEILPVHGIELLGPLPADFQHYIGFAAAVSAHAKNPDAAKALIKYLTGPAVAPTYKAKGMEPR